MVLYVKNMVCDRCIFTVEQRLTAIGLTFEKVRLGEIALAEPPTKDQLDLLRNNLSSLGFELLDDKKASVVSQIKSCIIRHIHSGENVNLNRKMSAILADTLGSDYNYLSALFSAVEGITIEKYVILQRIERVKELLTYNELNLNEIADSLHYSSVQHLSQQFKKVTGLTPTEYKNSAKKFGRTALDQVGS